MLKSENILFFNEPVYRLKVGITFFKREFNLPKSVFFEACTDNSGRDFLVMLAHWA